MKTKIIYLASLALLALPAAAQETYENTKLIDNDLNGTARYVGMGGAMEALGADLSTMGTNPAGTGLFRKSKAEVSFGLVSQDGVKSFGEANKTNASFDQVGFVHTMRTGERSFFNFGVNYHKSRNFDQILSVTDGLNNASQNKLTYQKLRNGLILDEDSYNYTQVDALYVNNLLYSSSDDTFYNYPATAYSLNRGERGYIGSYDFNFSSNLNDRVYLGMTLGFKGVHYKGYSEYLESPEANVDELQSLGLYDNREISGTGFDVKFGVIFRPIDASPFRIGAYIHTPTFYDLTTTNTTVLNRQYSTSKWDAHAGESYDYKVNTPWKFGLSLGHTVGNYLALGATYEYTDYSSMSSRYNNGRVYDFYYDSYDTSVGDTQMNKHTEASLKGVHTLKLGGEVKVTPQLAVRAGYNYVSAVFDKDAYKDGSVVSLGSYYASQTDYTNWKATNRLTCGLGYTVDKFNFDLAYQYSSTNGEFHPFMNYYESDVVDPEDNEAFGVDVKKQHHQLLFTVGYRF